MARLEYETPRGTPTRSKVGPAIRLGIAVVLLPAALAAAGALVWIGFEVEENGIRAITLMGAGLLVAATGYACWAPARELFGRRPPGG